MTGREINKQLVFILNNSGLFLFAHNLPWAALECVKGSTIKGKAGDDL